MPKPSSAQCTDEGGNRVFDDGSECEEWAFFRGQLSTSLTPSLGSDKTLLHPTWRGKERAVYLPVTASR